MKVLVLIIATVCGLPFLIIGGQELYQKSREINSFVHATGTVVENHYAMVSNDGAIPGAYLPVIEFYLPDGRRIRFTDQVGSLPPDYEMGAQLAVIYDSDHPQNARINSWKRLWLVPTLLMVVGALPFIVGVIAERRLNF